MLFPETGSSPTSALHKLHWIEALDHQIQKIYSITLGYIGVILGAYWDNGKENRNYSIIIYQTLNSDSHLDHRGLPSTIGANYRHATCSNFCGREGQPNPDVKLFWLTPTIEFNYVVVYCGILWYIMVHLVYYSIL